MKILFWFNGSGGQRTERKVVEYTNVTPETLHQFIDKIEDDLDEWKQSLNSQSQFRRWGWDENFDIVKLEPLSKTA